LILIKRLTQTIYRSAIVWNQGAKRTGMKSYLICSNDGLNSQVIVNHLDVRYSLRHRTECGDSCHGNGPRASRTDTRRRDVSGAGWCTVTCIAKEYVPRLSINTKLSHHYIVLSQYRN